MQIRGPECFFSVQFADDYWFYPASDLYIAEE